MGINGGGEYTHIHTELDGKRQKSKRKKRMPTKLGPTLSTFTFKFISCATDQRTFHASTHTKYSSHGKYCSWFAWIEWPLKYSFNIVAGAVAEFFSSCCCYRRIHWLWTFFSLLCKPLIFQCFVKPLPKHKRKKDSIALNTAFCLNKYASFSCDKIEDGEVCIPKCQALSYQCTSTLVANLLCGCVQTFLQFDLVMLIRKAYTYFLSILWFIFAKIFDLFIRTFSCCFASAQTLPLFSRIPSALHI